MVAFKLATLLAVATAVTAYPGGLLTRGGGCSTGTLQCCDQVQQSGSSNYAALLGVLPTSLQGTNVPLGVNCNPISVVGGGTAGSCSAQTACCAGNYDVVGFNCDPVAVPI